MSSSDSDDEAFSALVSKKQTARIDEDSSDESDLEVGGSSDDEPAAKQPLKKRRVAPVRKKGAKKPAARGALADSSDDEATNEFDDGFGEDLMGDADDRATLAAMSEMQREEVIADRSEARRKMRERQETQRQIKAAQKREKEAAATAKKGVGLARQRSARQDARERKGATAAAKAAADIKKRLTQKAKLTRQSDSESEEEPEESESESESDEPVPDQEDLRRGRNSYAEEEAARYESESSSTPLDFETFSSLFLSRSDLEAVVHEQYFQEAVAGMFVRVSIGAREGEAAQYRACEIRGTAESGKRYSLGRTKTTIKLNLAFGRAERSFYMHMVSRAPVVEGEFERWVRQCKKDDVDMISKEKAQRMLAAHKKTVAQPRTNEMIQFRQMSLRKNGLAVTNASTRLNIEAQLEAARDSGDTEREQALQRQLDEHELAAAAKSQAPVNMDTKRIGWSAINRKNKAKNIASVRKQDMIELPKEKDARIRTVDSNYWSVGKAMARDAAEAAKEAAEAEEKAKKKNTGPLDLDELAAMDGGSFSHTGPLTPRSVRNAAKSAHANIDYDSLELPAELQVPAPAPVPEQLQSAGGKKRISLDDYRRRRAATAAST
eukprot:SAG11_NODE_3438_length_2448_cov_1.520647_1_plen_608_part_00